MSKEQDTEKLQLELEAAVARGDVPDEAWWRDGERLVVGECDRVCHKPTHPVLPFVHVYSRGGEVWHFCRRCDLP